MALKKAQTTPFKVEETLREVEEYRLVKERRGLDGFEEVFHGGNQQGGSSSDSIPAQKWLSQADSIGPGATKRTKAKGEASDTAAATTDPTGEAKKHHRKTEKRDRRKQSSERLKRREDRELARKQSGHPFRDVAVRKGLQSMDGVKVIEVILPVERVKAVSLDLTGSQQGEKGQKA
ncbi:hypothetical protein PQX77_011714 [Marasmius sp. AFHP31]|nr:hypothetical protein PQX77_011714 [Marasmius sp. AFHP31]